jgi:nitrogen fixation protein FixH
MKERATISLYRPRESGDPVSTGGTDVLRENNKRSRILGPRFRGDGSNEFRLTGRMVLAGLVAFFAVVVGVNGLMTYAAISTFGGVETESSYRAGLAFANEMASAHAQDARHWNVTAKAALNGDMTVLEVTARDAAGRPVPNLAAAAQLVHPTDRRGDVIVPLADSGAGMFRGETAAAAGQWDLVIELSRAGERLFRSKNRVWLH